MRTKLKSGRQERPRDNFNDIQEYSRKRNDINRTSLALVSVPLHVNTCLVPSAVILLCSDGAFPSQSIIILFSFLMYFTPTPSTNEVQPSSTQNQGRVCSTELVSIVRSRNMFPFSSDERAFNIESYFRTGTELFQHELLYHRTTVVEGGRKRCFRFSSVNPKIQDRIYSHTSLTVTVRSKNMFAFSSDEGAFNIASFSHRYQLNWKEHVSRMVSSRIPKAIMKYRPNGKRSLGRPMKRWQENSFFRP
ncbi:hypothetical protein ANN_27252 [Periplaneta americana]|uniref:Uncharacterized protein n=1 Tax=Periplaneta americana TaxID=6978 RepID=A0ABQ8RXN9_PERAM|nr:hypothetical protein ANN_27252 [Periplaneta americana]